MWGSAADGRGRRVNNEAEESQIVTRLAQFFLSVRNFLMSNQHSFFLLCNRATIQCQSALYILRYHGGRCTKLKKLRVAPQVMVRLHT